MNHRQFYDLLEQVAESRQTCWQILGHTINFNGKIWTFGHNQTGRVLHSAEPWTLQEVRQLLHLD